MALLFYYSTSDSNTQDIVVHRFGHRPKISGINQLPCTVNNSYKNKVIRPLRFYRCAIIITTDHILHS
jgi:hypothetical protein